MFPLKFLSSNYFHSSNNSIYIFPPQLTEFTWIKAIATPKMALNVKINTLNFDNKLKDCSSRRATEDHVTIRKTRGYKAKLGLGFFLDVFSRIFFADRTNGSMLTVHFGLQKFMKKLMVLYKMFLKHWVVAQSWLVPFAIKEEPQLVSFFFKLCR